MRTLTDYQQTISFNFDDRDFFECLTTRIPEWWSADFEGTSATPGDQFTVRFGASYKSLTVKDVIPFHRIVWQCTDALIDIADFKHKRESVGTSIIWEIQPKGGFATLTTFTHEGMNENFECYAVCEKGWQSFLDSLVKLITTGRGVPYSRNA